MKYRCAQCGHIFSDERGVRFDWRVTKRWFMPCPKRGTELHPAPEVMHFSIKATSAALLRITFYISLVITPRYMAHLGINKKYININIGVLLMLLLVDGVQQYLKAKMAPKNITNTIVNNE